MGKWEKHLMENTANNREPHYKEKGRHSERLMLMLDLFRRKHFPKRLHEYLRKRTLAGGAHIVIVNPNHLILGVGYIPYHCDQIHNEK